MTLNWKTLLALVVGVLFIFTASAYAQSDWPAISPSEGDPHEIERGAGGYLSWIKLLMLALLFFVWVRLADWINRDAVRYRQFLGMASEIWNPIVVFSFIGGLFAALTVPWFVVGYSVYVLTVFVPFGTYLMKRRGGIPDEEKSNKVFKRQIEEVQLPFSVTAGGKTGADSKANLVKARQAPGLLSAMSLVHDALRSRVDLLVLDYSQTTVRIQQQIDGQFHLLPEMGREEGDQLLESLKLLSGLNPVERQREQRGHFSAKIKKEKLRFDLSSQGTPTGERVLIRFAGSVGGSLALADLGMWPETVDTFGQALKYPGMTLISAPAGHGLSTTWDSALSHADRLTGDWVCVIDKHESETDFENIQINRFDHAAKQSPVSLLPGLALKMPDAYIVPDLVDAATLDWLSDSVVNDEKTVISRVRAQTAAGSDFAVDAVE